jgi:uncharacterized protein YxjI
MIEPQRTSQATTEFVLRPDFPNVFITDAGGRDRYWIRSGVAERLGLWSLRDLAGHELLGLRQVETWPLPGYSLERDGERLATVQEVRGPAAARWRDAVRMLVTGTPSRLRYSVLAAGGEPLEVEGDPTAVEYHFTRGGAHVATVGLRWLSWTPSLGLGVSVEPGEDPLLILAVTAMIESSWGRL